MEIHVYCFSVHNLVKLDFPVSRNNIFGGTFSLPSFLYIVIKSKPCTEKGFKIM